MKILLIICGIIIYLAIGFFVFWLLNKFSNQKYEESNNDEMVIVFWPFVISVGILLALTLLFLYIIRIIKWKLI
jgi:hypothetical protein